MNTIKLFNGYNVIILTRTGSDAELVAEADNTVYSWPETAAIVAEAALSGVNVIATCAIFYADGCERGISAWVKPHYITRRDWNMPAEVVFVGEAEKVKPVLSTGLTSLVRLVSLVRGL